jgi:hypothetical protein
MLIYAKLILIIRFIYSWWKYRVGSSTGVNLKSLFLDFVFLIFAVYLLAQNDSFTEESVYINAILILLSKFYFLKT